MEVSATETKEVVSAFSTIAQKRAQTLFHMLVQLTRGSVASKINEPLGTAPPSLSLPLKDLVFAGLNPSRRKGTIFIRAADVAVMNGPIGHFTEQCCCCVPAAQRAPRSNGGD